MNDTITIEVAERLMSSGTYHAQAKDRPEIWGCGKSWASAVGDLVMSHPEFFGVRVEDVGLQAR